MQKNKKNKTSRFDAFRSCCCFGCCAEPRIPLTAANGLLVARAILGTIIAVHVLITFIWFGANMDVANFPGSNLKFAEYQADDNSNNLTYDPDRAGNLVRVLDGYIIADTPGCNNFITTLGTDVCKADTDTDTDNAVEAWNNGWAVVQDCERSATNPTECAPFGASNGLAIIGQITFWALAAQTILFCAHTCVEVCDIQLEYITNDKGKKKGAQLKKMTTNGKVKLTVGLTVVWCIIGFALFGASAIAWEALCDKLDTGLGRHVQNQRACATDMCTFTFGQLFSTITFAIMWYNIPHLLTYSGVLEAV
jgi:hypothetical protein